MKRIVISLAFSVFTIAAVAATPAEQLAKDSYSFVHSKESMLDGAIKSGTKDDYNRFIYQPTVALFQKWPKPGDVEFDKARRCQFALDAFRVYSEDQFNARGQLPKTAPSAKNYFDQKAQCKALLGK